MVSPFFKVINIRNRVPWKAMVCIVSIGKEPGSRRILKVEDCYELNRTDTFNLLAINICNACVISDLRESAARGNCTSPICSLAN